MEIEYISILMQTALLKNTSLLRKLVSCLVAAVTTIALLLILGNSGTLTWFPPVIVFSLVGLCFVTAIVYTFAWESLERKNKSDSRKIYSFLNAWIRYTIAFNLASFGWKKILGLQFIVPESIAAKPMNQVSGEWLTWFYFGYSQVFGLILAFIQIVGAYLLLFRKTSLLAVITLFAFMLNLLLINIFYHMNAGALIQSVLLTIGLVYLLSLNYERLKFIFLNSSPGIPALSSPNIVIKNLVRISAIVLSLIFVLYLKRYVI